MDDILKIIDELEQELETPVEAEWEAKFDKLDYKYSKRLSHIKTDQVDKHTAFRHNDHKRQKFSKFLHKQGLINKMEVRRIIQEAV
jgi:hypothetical protein